MRDQSQEFQPSSGVEAPHATDPSGCIAARFIEPAGVLLQFMRPARGTTEMAEWLAGPGLTLLFERFPQSRDLLVILDMRLMTGRSASARTLLIQAGVRCVGRVGQAVVLPSQQMGETYLSVVEAGVALVRRAGLRVEIERDLPAVLARYAVRTAIEAPAHGGNVGRSRN